MGLPSKIVRLLEKALFEAKAVRNSSTVARMDHEVIFLMPTGANKAK